MTNNTATREAFETWYHQHFILDDSTSFSKRFTYEAWQACEAHHQEKIAALEADNKRLREGLKHLSAMTKTIVRGDDYGRLQQDVNRIAKQALATQPNTTKTVSYDLSPAMVESKLRDKLIEMGWTPPKPPIKAQDTEGEG